MVLCECACASLVWKATFNLINKTDLIICLHIKFKISFQNSKGQKSYCKSLGVWSERLLSIDALSSVCDKTGFDCRKQRRLLFSPIFEDLVNISSVKSWKLLGGKVKFMFCRILV